MCIGDHSRNRLESEKASQAVQGVERGFGDCLLLTC